jgi:hypothetical protein
MYALLAFTRPTKALVNVWRALPAITAHILVAPTHRLLSVLLATSVLDMPLVAPSAQRVTTAQVLTRHPEFVSVVRQRLVVRPFALKTLVLFPLL